jgi:hypothetical protein
VEFKELIAEIVTGLENGTFEGCADEPAKDDEDFQDAVNTVADLLLDERYTKWHLLAAETHIRKASAHVTFDEIGDYLEETFLESGVSVGNTLESYAARDDIGEAGALYRALDEAGGVDRFDWEGYADDGMTPTQGMLFVKVPAPFGVDSVYLFMDA